MIPPSVHAACAHARKKQRERESERGGRERKTKRDVGVCEFFITKGISLSPLIPSLGSPSLFHAVHTVNALAYPKADGAPGTSTPSRTSRKRLHLSPPRATCITQGEYALKQRSTPGKRVFFSCESTAKDVVVALWLWRHAECLLKPRVKSADTNTRLFALEMRGPLTGCGPVLQHGPRRGRLYDKAR